MRNPEEAAKALNLNGIPYLGNVLKLVSVMWDLLEGFLRSCGLLRIVISDSFASTGEGE